MRSRGFTLIELIVTIAVAVILLTVAVPSFQSLIIRNHYASDYNNILSGLTLSRSEAVKRREPVSFVIQQADDSSPWGYIVEDDDGSDLRSAESAHKSVRVFLDDTLVTSSTVTFDSLGKISSSDDCSGSGGCDIKIQGEASNCGVIKVSPLGRLGRESCG